MEFLAPSWEEIHVNSIKLALKVMRDYKPETLIGVLRGGYIIARIMTDVLSIKELGVVEVKFYRGVEETAEKPVITQPLVTEVRGKKVLIIDDVVDSGRTLQIVTEQVRLRGAKELKSAALYYKPRSIIRPDYFIASTSKWILFPWELKEFLTELKVDRRKESIKKALSKAGVSVSEELIDWLAKAYGVTD